MRANWKSIGGLLFCLGGAAASADEPFGPPPYVPLPPVFETPPIFEPPPVVAAPASSGAMSTVLPVSYDAPHELPAEVMPPGVASSPAVPHVAAEAAPFPIDLATTIHLAGSESLAVALAREQWREASARARLAEVLWLPSIRTGLNYNKHEGVIQDVRGTAFDTSRGALYGGLGAGAVGAGSPAYPGVVAQFHLADALFRPPAERQTAASRGHRVAAASNDALLEAALAYNDLVVRAQEAAVAAMIAEDAAQLVELTDAFLQAGAGSQADADRAVAERARQATAVAQADEAYAVARAQLAQVLRLDPTLPLSPADETLAPWELVLPDVPVQELVARGLAARPELAEQRHLVAAANERLRREQFAPLVPSLLVGASYGGFGAGIGGDIAGTGDRFDFDAVAYWELRNLGAGDREARNIARSQMNQACIRQLAAMDQVAREIVEAHARVESRRRQVTAARDAGQAALTSYRRHRDRIHGGEGLPIEALQALQAWSAAEREYVRAVGEFNAAQFALERALGWPIDGVIAESTP